MSPYTEPNRHPRTAAGRGASKPPRRGRKSGWLSLCVTLLVLSLATLLYLYAVLGWFRPDNRPLIHTAAPIEPMDWSADADQFLSQAAYVSDASTGQMVASFNSDTRLAPASLTKIMTVWVAAESGRSLNEKATVDYNVYMDMVDQGASMAGFYGDETVTLRDLLYGTSLPSGGEAAGSLAIAISGSQAAFVDAMNQKVAELGLKNTHFANPSGLDAPNHYSTAHDMAVIMQAALKNKVVYDVLTTPTYTSSPNLNHPDGIYMENSVIMNCRKGNDIPAGWKILGGKSGITDDAGRCWASLVERNGQRYVVVTLGAPMNQSDPPAQRVDLGRVLRKLQ